MAGRASEGVARPVAGKVGKYNYKSDWAKDYVPRTIYFYYATPKKVGALATDYDVRVYIWVNPDNDAIEPGPELDGLIVDLVRNARVNGSSPRPIGFAFDDVPWWRRSYLVVALESDEFVSTEAVEISRDDGHPNHCFFDGGDKKMTIDGKEISLMWTVNYMKKKSGKDLERGKIQKFDLRFNPKGPNFHRRRRDEPDHGTNMGPPIGPP